MSAYLKTRPAFNPVPNVGAMSKYRLIDWCPFPLEAVPVVRVTIVAPGAVPVQEIVAPMLPKLDEPEPPDRVTVLSIVPRR
jgi:hypothetical protein